MYESYHYPNEIKIDSNSHRSLSFYVYDQKGMVTSVSDALENAKKTSMELVDKIKVASGNINEMTSNLATNERVVSDENVCVITLPLPNTFNDTQSHGWNSQKSLVGDIGTNLANTSISDTSLTEVVGGILGASAGYERGGGAGAILGGVMGMVAGKSVRKSNISADAILADAANATGQRKPIIDPSYFQNYSGSTARSFSLKYDLVPNSTEEAEEIMMIIAKFKQYSSPTQAKSSPILYAPYHFKITNSNSYINLLTAIDTVVLSSISVDYGADGSMELFGDGMPKYISLSLNFEEDRVRTAEDYDSIPNKS